MLAPAKQQGLQALDELESVLRADVRTVITLRINRA